MAQNFRLLYGSSEPGRLRGQTAHAVFFDDLTYFGVEREHFDQQLRTALGIPETRPHVVTPRQEPTASMGAAVGPREGDIIQRMAQSIQEEEDRRIFDAIDAIAATEGRTPPRAAPSFIEPSYVMAPAHRGVVDLSVVRDPIDPRTRLFNREDLDRAMLRPGEVVAVSDPEFVGQMPIRQELQVLPADEPQAPLGFSVSERPGVGVVNARAARRVTMPFFEIASNPTVRLDDIRQRRFDLIDRAGGSRLLGPAETLWTAFLAAKLAPEPVLPVGRFED